MQQLNLTVIADKNCQTTYAYLQYLKANNFLPNKILLVNILPSNKKAQLLNRFLGNNITCHIYNLYISYRNKSLNKIERLQENLQSSFPIKVDFFKKINFNDYANIVEKVYVSNYEELLPILRKNSQDAFLYSGGGIVPKNILDDRSIKIFHIHPGVVPYVRGSDGLFWSILTRNKPGMSCFYMNEGIDTGDLIKTMEFEKPKFLLPTTEMDVFYRALLLYYDPHLRAQTFIEVLKENSNKDLRALDAETQDHNQGCWYFMMHKMLRERVMKNLIEA